MVGLRMRWGKQRQSYSTLVSHSQHLAGSFLNCFNYLGIIYSSFMDLEMQWVFGETSKLYKEFELSGPRLTFSFLSLLSGKGCGFPKISCNHFKDVAFGYFFLFLVCGPQKTLGSVLPSSVYVLMGLVCWGLCFICYKPVDLQLK